MHLPSDPKERKKIPLWSGLMKYFPDALVEVARVSQAGNDQHNPGQPLHWAREKSADQEDTLLRHLLDSGTLDSDGQRHSSKVAWRALALLQLEIERDRNETPTPLHITQLEFAPGCRFDYSPTDGTPHNVIEEAYLQLNEVNKYLAAGYDYVFQYQQGNNTSYIDLWSVSDPAGRSFVVRGKVQRKVDGERGEVQPGRTDRSLQEAAFWHALESHQSNYTSNSNSKDQ